MTASRWLLALAAFAALGLPSCAKLQKIHQTNMEAANWALERAFPKDPNDLYISEEARGINQHLSNRRTSFD